MKKLLSVLLLASALITPSFSAESNVPRKKKKDKAPIELKKDTVNADYKKVTKDGIIKNGMFTTIYNRKEGKLYFELPESAFSHTYLIANRIASTSNTQDFVAGQMAGNPLMVRFSKDQQKVYMHLVQNENMVNDNDPIKAAFDKNFIDPVLKGFKIVAKNKENVVIDVTAFFTGNEKCISPLKDTPFSQLLGGNKALKGTFSADASGLVNVKTFEKNIEIKSMLTFITSPLNVPYSVTVNRSFFVLPDEPMKMRLQDNRVGFFSSDKYLYTSNADQIVPKTYIHRWRMEPKPEDMERYFNGELVEPIKPIVFYVDTAFPEKWRNTVKAGIEDWNVAFEAAGFKNAIKAVDYPRDPDFDTDDMRYSCFKYAATPTANAMGPSHVDPRTGEILTGDVLWYHNIISLLHNWRFTQTAAVDKRVRQSVFDDEVMQESMRYAAAHEIGHTLGLMHNMGGSYSFPVDSLRSPHFTQKYGTTPSIMDYARNNFVAQPGDFEKGVKLTPPRVGVYDIYAINWGYRLIKGAQTPEDEKATLNQWIADKAGDPMYEFGAQQFFGTIDPTDQSEDLSNDHMRAGDLAISNLKITMAHLEEWMLEKGARYTDIENMYHELVRQYTRHYHHVMPYIGGVKFKEVRQGDNEMARTYVDKQTQRKAMKWLLNQARTCNDWLTPKSLIGKIEYYMNTNDKLPISVVGALLNPAVLYRIEEGGIMDAKNNFTLNEYLDEAVKAIFNVTGKLSDTEKEIQAAAIDLMINNSGLTKKEEKKKALALEAYDDIVAIANEIDLPCSYTDAQQSFARINFGMPVISTLQQHVLMTGQLKRVMQWYKSRRSSAPTDTRDFYDYQIKLIERALNNDK